MSTTKGRITQKQVALEAEITPGFFNHILKGRRPCPRMVALRLESVTGIGRNTWVWGSPEEMQKALAAFLTRQGVQHGH